MNRDQATKWLEQVKPLLSHETREALDVVLQDSRLVDASESHPVYYCDCFTNHTCPKRRCILEGGECRLTSNPDCAVTYMGRKLRAPMILEVEE